MNKPRVGRPPSRRGHRPDRRLDLVRAAYEIIAHDGLENLRTRRVAERAGVNVATLYYYYPTKESLIGAVALHLAALFATRAEPAQASSALQNLRQEFADVRFYLTERPEMIDVVFELNARARRDRAVAPIITPLKEEWRKSLARVVAGGIAEGTFRSDLAAADAAGVIVAMLWGAATFPLDRVEREHLFAAIECWLSAPAAGGGQARDDDGPRRGGAAGRGRRRRTRQKGDPS